MPLTRSLTRPSSRILSQYCSSQSRTSIRTFYNLRNASSCVATTRTLQSSILLSKRAFSSSSRFLITGQEAPDAKAYIASGVIAESKNRLDVKKVLVIGSGGLSIGQAGEFDYSGESHLPFFSFLLDMRPACIQRQNLISYIL